MMTGTEILYIIIVVLGVSGIAKMIHDHVTEERRWEIYNLKRKVNNRDYEIDVLKDEKALLQEEKEKLKDNLIEIQEQLIEERGKNEG